MPITNRLQTAIGSKAFFPVLMIMAVVILGIAAGTLSSHDPTFNDLNISLTPPFWFPGGLSQHPLGTDVLGRDILSRLLYGTRTSLSVALVVILVGGSLGTTIGLLSGYLGGVLDAVLMRIVDSTVALPTVLIALVCAITLGPGFQSVVIAISIPLWARIARVIRGECLSLRERDYVAYGRIAGRGPLSLMVLHILPNLMHTLIVILTVQLGGIITLEASLSFIGVGIPAPAPSWGRMIADGRDYLGSAWWLSTFPAIIIFVTVLSFNLIGDWVSDALNPRLKF